ncbi:MAG TPA: HIT family protein [Gaiellales bacterium]|nr:HIT family protein [Gaiellales bacterium]
MDDCIFCRIVADELPSTRIHEDDRAIVIMDINPATRGHALVIPRAHAQDISDISEEDLAHCAVVAKRIAARAVSGLGAQGVTIMQSNGAAAWQTVFHYHVHVIPRYDGDPLVLPWNPAEAAPGDISDISQAYFQH